MKKSNLKLSVLLLFPIVFIMIVHILKLTGESEVKLLMNFIFICTAVYSVWTAYKGKLTADRLIWIILFIGVLLRSGYMSYTHAFTRAYDIGMNDDTGVGHWGYLNFIMKNQLPDSNEYQFYQPPFYYILSSIFIRIVMAFNQSSKWDDFMYVAQAVSCTASCIGLVTMKFIMDELKIKKTTQIIPVLLTAVYPIQILTSGQMNNDSLVFMFIMLSLYATVLWAKNRTMTNIILIAIFIGFGMMTKINCGVVALITGPVMVYQLVRYIKDGDGKKIKSIILQLCVFAVIVFPLGLWYPIRNLILFDQPLNFVHVIDKGHPIYSGKLSFFERWIKFPLFNFVNEPYCNLGKYKNIIQSLIQTGVHGEFDWKDNIPKVLAGLLDYTHIILLLLALAAIIAVMFKEKDLSKMQKWSVFSVWALWAVMYIQFNEAYKYSCSANFRYVLPAQLAAAVFIGYFLDFLKKRNTQICRILSYGVYGIVYLFSAMSILHFI